MKSRFFALPLVVLVTTSAPRVAQAYTQPEVASIELRRDYFRVTFKWNQRPDFPSGITVEFQVQIYDKCFTQPLGGKDDSSAYVGKHNLPLDGKVYQDVWNYWAPTGKNLQSALESRCGPIPTGPFADAVSNIDFTEKNVANFAVGLHDASALGRDYDKNPGKEYYFDYSLGGRKLDDSRCPSDKRTDGLARVSMQHFSSTCQFPTTSTTYECPELIGLDLQWPFACAGKDAATDFWINRLCVPTTKWTFHPGKSDALGDIASPGKNVCVDEDEDSFSAVQPSRMFGSNVGDCLDCNDKISTFGYSKETARCEYFCAPSSQPACTGCNSSECSAGSYCNPFCKHCTTCASKETNCADSLDDDCDGKTDCADPDCAAAGNCSGTASPSCSDGKQNQSETGVDCGGPCKPCPLTATCFDKTKNQNELSADCGGVCQGVIGYCPYGPGGDGWYCGDKTKQQDESKIYYCLDGNYATKSPLSCHDPCHKEAACKDDYCCGDGKKNGQEKCDGTDLGGATCTSIGQGFSSGTLKCAPNCTLDTSSCSTNPTCGDGSINGTEQCDGQALGGQTCITQGFSSGALACTGNCLFDKSNCSMVCAQSCPECMNCNNGTGACDLPMQSGSCTGGTCQAGVCVPSNQASELVVADFDEQKLSFIDLGTFAVKATVKVPGRPRGLAKSPDGSKIYVANSIGDSISVVDVTTHTLSQTWSSVCVYPLNPAAALGSLFVPCSDTNNNKLLKLNGMAGVQLGSLQPPADNPDGFYVFPVSPTWQASPWGLLVTGSTVQKIELDTVTVLGTASGFGSLHQATYSPQTDSVWVADSFQHAVHEFGTSPLAMWSSSTAGGQLQAAYGVAADPTRSAVYVSDSFGKVFSVGTNGGFLGSVDVPANCEELLYDQPRDRLWLVSVQASGVVRINPGTLTVEGTVLTGTRPQSMLIVP